MRVRHGLTLVSAAVMLAACGGGQEKLYVSVNWADKTADVLSPTLLRPTLSGFDGHDAECSQHGGVMAPGMRLNSDCTISGTPTTPGTYTFEFDIRAEGADGKVDDVNSVTVVAPILTYAPQTQTVRVGAAATASATITGGWTPPPVTSSPRWNFTVAGGALPPGMTLNAASGAISGTPTATGTFTASIQGVLTTNAGSYTMGRQSVAVTVSP